MSKDRKSTHILTVALEDYFHGGTFNNVVQWKQWYRFEKRFEKNTLKTLDLLDRFGIKATFFVLGWVADEDPGIIKEVVRRGHEIASRGYYHRRIRGMTPVEFREDLSRSKDALEAAGGKEILGYRAAHRWYNRTDLWALDILAEEGYAYDSSIFPFGRSFHDEPWRRFAHQHVYEGKKIWEFPFSTYSLFGFLLPIAGGNYFRQLPEPILRRMVAQWDRKCDAPFVMYFNVWELDPDQPRINAVSTFSKIRQYRKLDHMEAILEEYLHEYRFTGIADYLGLKGEPLAKTLQDAQIFDPSCSKINYKKGQGVVLGARRDIQSGEGTPKVTVVVPCFNEDLVIPYLANTMQSVRESLREYYDLRFIFMDDGSTDKTLKSLRATFGDIDNHTILQNPRNIGVAATMLRGIRHSDTEIICSIDCDCSYDPHELINMIPMLVDGVDLVTASPYHPEGKVLNVPGWRLALSKISSFLYRRVLRQKLYTYTSCFRVYRRSAVADLRLRYGGFLGVAELIGQMDLRGGKIIEYPTTLAVRMLGRSKMKVLRTILGHLRLMGRLLWMRLVHTVPEKYAVPAEQTQKVETGSH